MIAIVTTITIKNHSFLKKLTMLSIKRFMGGAIYALVIQQESGLFANVVNYNMLRDELRLNIHN